MNKNFNENILTPSIEMIRSGKKIKLFYFFPALCSTVFMSVLLVYQVIYTYVVLLEKKDKAFELILTFFHSNYLIETVISVTVFVLLYMMIIPVFEWALIRYIHLNHDGKASRSDSIWFGLFRFYPLFEFNNTFNMFKFISIINGFLFTLRFLGVEYLSWLTTFFFIAFIFSIIINILTAYARYEIVLENKGVFEAIGISSQIALLNIKTTIQLYIFMFFMNIKVVINFMVFLVFPVLWAFLAGFISSQIFTTIAFFVLGFLFIVFILILGYFTAVLDVFRTTIWYHAYIQGKKKLKESNV